MAYTLGQAAKACGKSKPTISRAIASGKISATRNADNTLAIEPVELFRIFPPVTPESTTATGALVSRETPSETGELRELRQRLADKDEVIADLRARLDAEAEERRRLTAILTDQSPRPSRWKFWKR